MRVSFGRFFQSCSGYDFGYLLKLLTCDQLPHEESQFFKHLHIYFPCIYDIKYLMKSCKNLKGGLQDVADDLKVHPISHQGILISTWLLGGTCWAAASGRKRQSVDSAHFLPDATSLLRRPNRRQQVSRSSIRSRHTWNSENGIVRSQRETRYHRYCVNSYSERSGHFGHCQYEFFCCVQSVSDFGPFDLSY